VADIIDGCDYASGQRAMPAGLIPRVVQAAEWEVVSHGVRQRVRALERLLSDVYGPRDCFDDGVVPWRLAFTSGKFRREAAGFTPPNGVRVHVAGVDVCRDELGKFRVVADNVRMPGGVGSVLGNRLPGALRAAAPHGVADPFVVVLTPGVHNAAYFEHTLLARLMGVELVEGRDLFCRRNRVYADTTHGQRSVDVIYRRVDDDWLDPLHFRPDSLLGCPGLVNAARAGNVTIANAVGNGVADGKLIYPYVPGLIRYYLGEEPVLEQAGSFRLDDDQALRLFAVNDGSDVSVLPAGPLGPARDARDG
jgi:uncharacterized circularly permuted ATP-grasp superfamily protein